MKEKEKERKREREKERKRGRERKREKEEERKREKEEERKREKEKKVCERFSLSSSIPSSSFFPPNVLLESRKFNMKKLTA